MSKIGRFPKKKVHITIETDYPNAAGIMSVAARELHEQFARKPYYNVRTEVTEIEGDLRLTRSVVPAKVQRATDG